MDCHIIPMSYLKPWTTSDTIKLDRDKRKTFIIPKTKISSKGTLIETEKIKSIKIENFYLLDLKKIFHLHIVSDYLIAEMQSDISCSITKKK